MTIKEFWEQTESGEALNMFEVRMMIKDIENVIEEMRSEALSQNDDNIMYFVKRFEGVPEEELY